MGELQDNLKQVEERIQAACLRAGRRREEVSLIAVSKTKPLAAVLEAMDCGIHVFGENKVQEMLSKQEELETLGRAKAAEWHMIGHLQTNKVKSLIGRTALIHSVDSLKLAAAIEKESEKAGQVTPILLEINVAGEESKFGFRLEETLPAAIEIGRFPHILLRGLMTVAPYTEKQEENRKYFRKLRELLIDINSKNIDNINMDILSMGMTGDYEVAIEEGATCIRVGTGIFGIRNYNNKIKG